MSAVAVPSDVGVVVIARNEGERLLACLDSLRGQAGPIVYADSDSSDESVERVRARGLEVVVLDNSRPLNAARGRNAGLARLVELHPALEYVFFMDGDCLVVPGFMDAARAELACDAGLAAVCGRRRELHPEASLFNRVVDGEWDTPVGEAEAFGGDVLVRVSALRAAGGYDEALNQGEDPELAFRLRRAGWRIRRIQHDMTRHDVALTRFAAWRRRHQRGGYAYAHGAALHWREPGRYNQRACLSILFWGLVLPSFAFLSFLPSDGLSVLLLLAYGRLWWRIRAQRLARGSPPDQAALYATLITIGKSDEAVGVLRCLFALATGRQPLTLEYKEYQRNERGRAAA
ncbi:MAG: glycosyltransferase [Planctomycetes bacterium]|nr:glycosyltransferase [Planctomycetota bacterium]